MNNVQKSTLIFYLYDPRFEPEKTDWTLEDWYHDLGAVFMPHGIGHMMGKDVHDTPIAFCRQPKTILKPGMVLTIEPGIYFIKPLIQKNQSMPFLNHSVINEYLDFGGVRIEDDVVVTETGYLNLTTAPKEIQDIEKIM